MGYTYKERRKVLRKNRRENLPIQFAVLAIGGCVLLTAAPHISGATAYLDAQHALGYAFDGAIAPGARTLLSNDELGFGDMNEETGRFLSDSAPSPPCIDPDAGKSCLDKALEGANSTGFPDLPFGPDEDGASIALQMFVVFYTFMGLAIICDVYFEASLEAITDTLKLKDDVAGATFMAAGGSAPELSTSVLGVFVAESDVGIGTIVGSAVFNVLFVIACCAFVAPNLRLSWWPLARDSVYYCVSIFVLALLIVDKKVYLYDALILLAMYAGYVAIMYYNENLEEWVNGRVALTKQPRKPWQKNILWAIDQHLFNIALYFLIIANTGVVVADLAGAGDSDVFFWMNLVFSLLFIAEMVLKWSALGFFGYWRQPLNCFDGVLVMLIIVEYTFSYVSAAVAEDSDGCGDDGGSAGFQGTGAGRSLRIFRFFKIVRGLRVFRLYRAFHKHYADATTQVLPGDWHQTANGMLAPDKNSSRASQAELNKVEAPPRVSTAGEPEPGEDDDDDDDDGPADPFEVPESMTGKVFWVLGMPLSLAMWITIPDCRRPAFERFWFLTFSCSILWIAMLAYFMVWMVTDFGHRQGIPDSIMGLTLLASGTSIPDCLSSIAVARRGHGDMAVSSSIGSNIFDILIGLPVPWALYCIVFGVDKFVEIKSDSLIVMILLLFLMVALVITTVHLCSWRLLIKLGYMMMLLYFIFVAISLLLSFGVFGC
tara:strand:+ start:968 stop:3106 length:2139 start_codon:yes stop_codon:yes gene_type:complete